MSKQKHHANTLFVLLLPSIALFIFGVIPFAVPSRTIAPRAITLVATVLPAVTLPRELLLGAHIVPMRWSLVMLRRVWITPSGTDELTLRCHLPLAVVDILLRTVMRDAQRRQALRCMMSGGVAEMTDFLRGRGQSVPSIDAHGRALQRTVGRRALRCIAKCLDGTSTPSPHRRVQVRMIRERVRPTRSPVSVRIGVRLDQPRPPSDEAMMLVVNHLCVRMVAVLHLAESNRLRSGLTVSLALGLFRLVLLLAPFFTQLLELCRRIQRVPDRRGCGGLSQLTAQAYANHIVSMRVPFGLLFRPCRCMVMCSFKWFKAPYAFEQFGQLSNKMRASQ